MILDKEADITHDAFASQIEARLGSGEGDNAKGPDMKVWNKGRNLGDVNSVQLSTRCGAEKGSLRSTGNWRSSVTRPLFNHDQLPPAMISSLLLNQPPTPSRTKVCFWLQLACGIRDIVPT
jgi:hypothetical protein